MADSGALPETAPPAGPDGARARPADPEGRPYEAGWAVVVGVLALAARLYRIDAQPFWLDEVLTWQRIHLPPAGLVADSFANRHFPTYFLLLKGWAGLRPADFGWLRVPSAVFSAAAAAVVFLVARRAAGRGAGVVAGLLMALSPLQVQYGQEARPYALVELAVALALWGLVSIARQPVRMAADRPTSTANRSGWGLYLAGSLLALLVMGAAASWLLAANLALYLVWRGLHGHPARGRAFVRPWWVGQALVGLCCAPFYAAVVAAGGRTMLENFNWVPPVSWHALWVVSGSTWLMHGATVVSFGLLPLRFALLAPPVAMLAAIGLHRLRGQPAGWALACAFAVPPLLVLCLSAFRPLLVPRYILWSAVPFFVMAGVGCAALGRRRLPVAAACLLALCTINLLPLYRMEIKPEWDAAAATLAARVRPGDTVLTQDPNAPVMLRVLQPPSSDPIEHRALVTDDIPVALARWRAGSRVWAVYGRPAMGDIESLRAYAWRLAALGRPVRQWGLGKEITLLLFPPAAGTDRPGDGHASVP